MTPLEALLPRMEGIPEGPELSALADQLAGGSGRRITEITYAWRDGSPSMAVLTGDARARIWPEKGGLHLIRGPEQIYPYVLYLPEGCRPGGEKRWPVIFFFHGIGDRGDDLKGVLRRGLPAHLEKGRGLDAIVIAPQCPADSHWADSEAEIQKLLRFIPQMEAAYPIDRDRMYLTGLSMGGRCTWKLALALPEVFAAAAVVCGRTENYGALPSIRTMPLWLFHGVEDGTTPFRTVSAVVPRLLESGCRELHLTVYPYLGHDVWSRTYARADLYDWLLAQSLSGNRKGKAAPEYL